MKEKTPTPHIGAKYGEIAPTMIMAGDPLRAKFIAETYLENPVLFNEIRNMYGYTGTYKGKRISVMGHGMGIPSIALYTYELFNFYDVETIIRVGTCGAMREDMKLGTMVLAQAASTDSSYGNAYGLPGQYAAVADFDLLRTAADVAEARGLDYRVGNVLSSDVFYDAFGTKRDWTKLGLLCVEMEAYALYINAAVAGKKALTILSVTDSLLNDEIMPPAERQVGLRNMIELALETLCR